MPVQQSRCAARRRPPILVLRAARAAAMRVKTNQTEDGGFGEAVDSSRRLSTTVWSLLALRAAVIAGIEVDPAIARRGRECVEKTVSELETRNLLEPVDPVALTRSRAARGVARLGAGVPSFPDDLDWLCAEVEATAPGRLDAETILFTTILESAFSHRDADPKRRALTKLIVEARASRSEGCSAGSWLVPSIWTDTPCTRTETRIRVGRFHFSRFPGTLVSFDRRS